MKFITPEPNYGPLNLPSRGDDLCEGRQYQLDTVATSYLKEQGITSPLVVECISRRYFARRIETITTNLETGIITKSEHIDEARPATFRVSAGRGRFLLFSLPCEELHETRKSQTKVDNADHTLQVKNLANNKHPTKKVNKPIANLDFLLE